MNNAQDWLHSVPDNAKRVVRKLASAGYETVFVGGSVRDLLMGRSVHDFDIATSARPTRVLELFPQAIPTGLPHGTVTVVEDGVPFEVTTYRVDLGYSDGRRPDAVEFSDSLVEDLKRRDFTINAMALRLSGELVDPFDGQADISNHMIRAVGDPILRFTEDSLRILRAIRFSAQLGFSIERATKDAMHKAAVQLKNVSTERIGQELFKMAQADWLMILSELASRAYFGELPTPFTQLRDSLEQLENTLCIGNGCMLRPESQVCAGWREFLSETEQRLAIMDPPFEMQSIPIAALCTAALWVSSPSITESEIRSLCRCLAWSKAFTREVLRVRQQLLQIPSYEQQGDWQKAMFGGGAYAVWVASALCDWQNDIQTADKSSNGIERAHLHAGSHRRTCEAVYQKMPIRQLRDLQVDGQVLKEAGLEGPMIGKMLAELARAVLAGEVENTSPHLLTYIAAYEGGREQHE